MVIGVLLITGWWDIAMAGVRQWASSFALPVLPDTDPRTHRRDQREPRCGVKRNRAAWVTHPHA